MAFLKPKEIQNSFIYNCNNYQPFTGCNMDAISTAFYGKNFMFYFQKKHDSPIK